MDLRMSAVLTDADITAQAPGLAFYDGRSSFFLNLRQVRATFTEGLIGRLKHFLDVETRGRAGIGVRGDFQYFLEFPVSHVPHLPTGQKDLRLCYAKSGQDGDRL